MKPVRDFRFKQFTVSQEKSTHKIGTDGVLLGAWASVVGARSVLDIGTGTGVIALMIAQRTGDAVMIDALEIQAQEAAEAADNFRKSPWSGRLKVYNQSLQGFSQERTYDLIVSNPPFFENSWAPPDAKRTLVRHNQALSFEDLILHVKRLLSNRGRFSVILPTAEGRRFISIAASAGLYCCRRCEFQARKNKPVERLLMEFSFQEGDAVVEELVLYSDGGEWSDQYWRLTGDFYLNRPFGKNSNLLTKC